MDFNSSDEIALLFKHLVIMPSDKAEQPAEIAPQTDTKEQPKDKIHEVKPFALLLDVESSSAHLAPNSSLTKILKKHDLLKLLDYTVLTSQTINPTHYKCLWCIGLDANTEADIKVTQHKNVLFSPNIESLTTKDEKLQMYAPFQEFVHRNKELFSQL